MTRLIACMLTAVLLGGCVYAPPPPAYPAGYYYPSGYYAPYPGYYYPGYYSGYYYGPPAYGSVFVRGRWR